MAIDVKQYIEQLAQTAELSAEDKAALLKVASNEKFAKGMGDDILRQQDYSRNMDALKADRGKWEKFYSDMLAWKADQDAYYAGLANGTNGSGQQPQHGGQVVNGEYLTKKDLEALDKKYQDELNRREGVQITLLKQGMALASQHVAEFHEPLDTEALAKIATDKNMSLQQAYGEMVGTRRAEAQRIARDAEIAKAREEGAREFASKHKIPVDTQPREYHVMLDRDPKKQVGVDDYVPNSGKLSPQAERQLRANFVEAWDAAQPTTNTSGT